MVDAVIRGFDVKFRDIFGSSAMNFEFLNRTPWFGRAHPDNDLGSSFGSTTVLMEQPKRKDGFNLKLWGWSILSVVPWALSSTDRTGMPPTVNRQLKRRAQSGGIAQNSSKVMAVRFRPYVSKVPWHTGPRALLSQLFPRYGHYCGPNWSSGKDGGSPLWDQRPIDWLDYCCYCHDMGYDTHDQAKLLEADLAFLECLEKPHYRTEGNAHVAHLYKTMCTTGLKNFLIPYRAHLVKLKSRQPLIDFGWLSNMRWRSGNIQKN